MNTSLINGVTSAMKAAEEEGYQEWLKRAAIIAMRICNM